MHLNGADGTDDPDFSQVIVGGAGDKLRDGNTVVRGKRNSLRSDSRRAGKRIERDSRLRYYDSQRTEHDEKPEREEP